VTIGGGFFPSVFSFASSVSHLFAVANKAHIVACDNIASYGKWPTGHKFSLKFVRRGKSEKDLPRKGNFEKIVCCGKSSDFPPNIKPNLEMKST
jgi:hypothetical protein